VPEGANRKGISGQGRLLLRPGKPDALKDACPVWEEAVGNVPQGNALAAYFIKQASHSWPGGGTSLTAPLPLYERGVSLKTSATCASCALDRSSHREAAMICYGQSTIVLCFGQLF
jgi:hypothetical protein